MLNSDGAPRISHDGHKIRRRHLRPDEFLRGGQRAQLVTGRHGGHIEVQRQQATILVAGGPGRFGRNLSAAELVEDVDILRIGSA